MIKIDLKDRKIIYELDINSRQSYNDIAKKVGLSKDSVIYRIKNLQRECIIKQYHTVIDVGKLGYISFRLYMKFQNTTPEKEAEIFAFLKKQRIVTWFASFEGEYDLGMWILVKSVKEMNTLWKELLNHYRDFIEKRWLTIFTKVTYLPRTYILEQKVNRKEYLFITESEEISLDKTDRQLLQLLAPDARISILKLAQKTHITPKTVTARIKQLKKKKVIIGYRTLLDMEKLGYLFFKVLFNLHNLTEQKEKEFRAYLRQNPNIIYDDEVLGGEDIEVDIQVPSIQDLRKFLEEIKKQFADIIRKYNHLLIYKEHKYVYFPS